MSYERLLCEVENVTFGFRPGLVFLKIEKVTTFPDSRHLHRCCLMDKELLYCEVYGIQFKIWWQLVHEFFLRKDVQFRLIRITASSVILPVAALYHRVSQVKWPAWKAIWPELWLSSPKKWKFDADIAHVQWTSRNLLSIGFPFDLYKIN